MDKLQIPHTRYKLHIKQDLLQKHLIIKKSLIFLSIPTPDPQSILGSEHSILHIQQLLGTSINTKGNIFTTG